MADLSGKSTVLEAKIKKLITLHTALKADSVVFQADNQKLTETIHKQQEQIRQLKEENDALKVARSLNSDSEETDLPEVKAKVNEMIRDIDKCLALLSK